MKYKVFVIIIAVILVAGIIGSISVLNAPQKNTVRILADGEERYVIDLSTAEDTTFDIKTDGHVNTIEIKDQRIRVASADCPDKTCVNMGWLSTSAMPIVCLPHRLVIEYADSPDGVDAVTR